MRTTDRNYEQALTEKSDAARALYYAEIALHDAHQTRVEQWIAAAEDHLHLAVLRYSAAAALVASLDDQPCAA